MKALFATLSENPLLLHAVFAGLLASVVSGLIGSYVVVKRTAFISGGIAHAVLGGIGLALWLQRVQGVTWAHPLIGSLIAAFVSAILLGLVHIYSKEREDSAIAALWAIGVAVGILFISQTPGFNMELTGYLIGNILWVSQTDLYTLALLNGVVLSLILILHKRFLLLCFDEEEALLQNTPVRTLYLLLLVLTALSIVLLIQVMGIILVMAMLTIPASIATLFTTRLSRVMMLAIGISSFFSLIGIAVAYQLDWPGGATIVLIAGGVYAATLLCAGARSR